MAVFGKPCDQLVQLAPASVLRYTPMSVPTNHCSGLSKANAYIGTSGRPVLTATQLAVPAAGTVPRHTCWARPKPLNTTMIVFGSPGTLITSQIHCPVGS